MKQLISLKNICRSYRNGDQELQVLKNINLEVQEGEFVAIKCPSRFVCQDNRRIIDQCTCNGNPLLLTT